VTDDTEQRDIEDLHSRYALAMDRGDRDMFASVWSADAHFRCDELKLDRCGLDDILDYFDLGPGRAPSLPAEGSSLRLGGNRIIDISGDSARGSAEFVAFRSGPAGILPYTFGLYEDEYVRIGDGWRISSRTMIVAPLAK
jgi:hypothetical protein